MAAEAGHSRARLVVGVVLAEACQGALAVAFLVVVVGWVVAGLAWACPLVVGFVRAEGPRAAEVAVGLAA